MKIIADENIPLLDAFFADMSRELIKLPGREMTNAQVKDADVLLVRSITHVNESLLKSSKVKFVGTCTIGTDHLDAEYLTQQGIQFHNAPGCNAHAVVDYVLSALLCLAEKRNQSLTDFSVGIVGAGNVGSRLFSALSKMGLDVCAYDPNVETFSSDELKEKVWRQDVVSLHVPITQEGEHKTHHLVDAQKLNTMKDNACLINSCRGLVVDNQALLNHLNSNDKFDAVMDVWEDEPSPSDELMKACLLATPHIAGYSLDGKLNGTEMIYQALCEFMALPKRHKLAQLVDEPWLRKLSFAREASDEYQLKNAIRSAYDIRDDHFRMLALLGLRDSEKAKAFDRLRKVYPHRRDSRCLMVSGKNLADAALSAMSMKLKS